MKHNIGDIVKHDGQEGEVLAINVTTDGIRYTLSSREVDFQTKTIIEGVKHVMEDELEEDELEEDE